MKQFAIFVATALVLTLGIGFAIGAVEDAETSVGTSSAYTTPAIGSFDTAGGNVTQIDVTSNAGTTKWQGFWGNISRSMRLGDGTDVFYDWTSITVQAVFASPDNAVNWSSATALSGAASRATKDTEYGFSSADADSINNTFTGAACAAGTVLAAADGAYTLNQSGSDSAFETCLGQDAAGVSNAIFGTTVVEAGSPGFNGQSVQYQLMVPVNASGQTYYFYLEI